MTLRTIKFDDEQWQVVPREATPEMAAAWEAARADLPLGISDDEASLICARANWTAMRLAAPEPPDMDADWLDHMPNEDERKWEQIEAWARASYRSHRSAIRGQMVTRADAYEHHIACAALKWARENPEPPAQQPMTDAELEDQPDYWHHWYLKTHEELEAIRQGWIRVIDEFLVTRHLGIASPTDTYDEARAKLLKIINFEIDIATDPVVGGDRVRKKVPMTDEEAKALISPVLRSVPAGDLPQVSTGYFIAMMRAVERHHGIGKGESNEG